MRSDMAKVLVERPRHDSSNRGKPNKGYFRRLNRVRQSGDGEPANESMCRNYDSYINFNEHLSPLRRFLHSQVGRPWNKIYSEICARIDRGNVVQKHVLTHLFDYVVVDAVWRNGVPYYPDHRRSRWVRRDQIEGPYKFAVNPAGILVACENISTKAQRRQRREQKQKARGWQRQWWIDKTTLVRQLSGDQWIMLTCRPIPPFQHATGFAASFEDVYLRRTFRLSEFNRGELINQYGKSVYAVACRPISKGELKSLPIPHRDSNLKLPNIVR